MLLLNRRYSLLLVLFLFTLFLEVFPHEAEAARRGRRRGFAGRRVVRGQVRRNVGGRRFARNGNVGRARVARNNFNNNQISNFLDNINDPTLRGFNSNGDLQRLVVAPNFAVNRFGQVVRLNNGDILDPTLQTVPIVNRQFIPVSNFSRSERAQLDLLNETGNFSTFRR